LSPEILYIEIKFRESFRPFASSILRENVQDYFDLDDDSPYMLLVADIFSDKRCNLPDDYKSILGLDKLNFVRSKIPAFTHVDYSARI